MLMLRRLIALLGMVAVPGTLTVQAAVRPNILFLLADDLRPDAIHALGNRDVRTPNLDRLVRRGMAFTQAFCMGSTSGAVCAPSRAMLMSGRSLFRFTGDVFNLQDDFPLLPEALKQSGYATFITGKWHNGRPWLARSFTHGAEIFFGGMGKHTELPVFDFDASGIYPMDRAHPIKAFSSEAFATAAIAFMKSQPREQPFFAYVSFTAPHDPRTPPKKFREFYDPVKLTLPANFLPAHPFDNGELKIRDEELAPTPRTKEVIGEHLADYYGMVSHLDEQVGRILTTLEESGLAQNTIVVFASDHGLALGSHGLLGKQNLYEHSMGAPLIFAGPGIPAQQASTALCYLLDLYPTLCELTGTPVSPGVEGRSLAPILRGQTQSVRESIFTAYRDVQRAVRDHRWKLIWYPPIDRYQFFDLRNDPDEMRDLYSAANPPPEFGRLREQLRVWQTAVNDPHPR